MPALHSLRRLTALFCVVTLIASSSAPLVSAQAAAVESFIPSSPQNSEVGDDDTVSSPEGDFVPGEVLVKFKEEKVDVSRFFGRITVNSFAWSNRLDKEDELVLKHFFALK